eukprot:11524288-Alexandrium_andersonii.AAC.1
MVHRFAARADHRLRLRWEPQFVVDGAVVSGAGAVADRQSAPLTQLLAAVALHSGVLAHASTRALGRAGWRVEEGIAASEGDLQLQIHPAASEVACKLA